jgi:hypothetical protein
MHIKLAYYINTYVLITTNTTTWSYSIFGMQCKYSTKNSKIQWNFCKPDPQKTGPPWISANHLGPYQTILCKGSLTKPATPQNRPCFLVPVLTGLQKLHCTSVMDILATGYSYKAWILLSQLKEQEIKNKTKQKKPPNIAY